MSSDEDDTTPLSAQRKVIGDGGNVKVRAKVLLFDYLDDDYDNLDGDDINEEEKRIENADSKKRELVGQCCRLNHIKGGPALPEYDGMTAAEADEARINYNQEHKKFRDELRRERLQSTRGDSFDDAEYTGDLTPKLLLMADIHSSHLKLGQTFPDRDLSILRVAEEANYCGISFSTNKNDDLKLHCNGPNSFLVRATNSDKCG